MSLKVSVLGSALCTLLGAMVVAVPAAAEKVAGLYGGGSPLFDRPELLSNASSTPGENITVTDFAGNLLYARNLYSFEGEGNLDMSVSLTYNGSVAHNIVTEYRDYNASYNPPWPPIVLNSPEWILSVNGIAVQVFNFQVDLYSWFRDIDRPCYSRFDHALLYDSVSLPVAGYHMNVTTYQGYDYYLPRSKAEVLLGDGSIITIYNGGTVDEGLMTSDNRQGFEKAWSELFAPSRGDSELKKEFWLKPGDGTTIYGKTHHVQWLRGWQETIDPDDYSGGMEELDTMGSFLPDSIYDSKGNVINLTYTNSIGGYFVYGHPLLTRIELNHDPRRAVDVNYNVTNGEINWVTIGDYRIDIKCRPDQGSLVQLNGLLNRGYVTRITDPEGRQTDFEYERYVRGITGIVSHSGFDFTGWNGGFACFNYHTPDDIYPALYRINEIRTSGGGVHKYQYYRTSVGVDSIAQFKWQSGYSGNVPHDRYSACFDVTGRDCFYSNMVSSASKYTALAGPSDLVLVSKDSLQYGWTPRLYYSWDTTLWTDVYSDSLANPVTNGTHRQTTFRMYPYSMNTYPKNGGGDNYEISWKTVPVKQADPFDTAWFFYEASNCTQIQGYGGQDGCDGSLRLVRKEISKQGKKVEYTYDFELAADNFNYLSDTVYTPAGDKCVSTINYNWLTVNSPGSMYINSNLSKEQTCDASTGTLLSETGFAYYTGSSDGYPGQLHNRGIKDIKNGSVVGYFEYDYKYYKNADEGFGNLKRALDPEGHAVDFHYSLPLGSIGGHDYNLSYQVASLDGGVTARHELVDNFKADCAYLDSYVTKRGGYIDTIRQYRAYDRFGRPTRTVDASGKLSVFDYDNLGRVSSTAVPLSFEPLQSPNEVITRADLSGYAAHYDYDDLAYDGTYTRRTTRARLTLTGSGGGQYSYQDLETRKEYDGLDRNTQTDHVSSDETFDFVSRSFDHRNLVKSGTDQNGNITKFEYDKIGRLVETTYPDPNNSTTQATYGSAWLSDLPTQVTQLVSLPDPFLSYVTATDENGHSTTTYSDAVGQKRFVKSTVSNTDFWTAFDYDNLGNLTKVVRPEGDVVRYEQNSLGQVVREWSNDYDTIYYAYDKKGNLVGKKDGHLSSHLSYPQDSLLISDRSVHVDGEEAPYSGFEWLYPAKSGRVWYNLRISNSSGQSSTIARIKQKRGTSTIKNISISGCTSCSQGGWFNVLAGDIVELWVYHDGQYGDPVADVTSSASYYIFTNLFVDWQYFKYDELNRSTESGAVRHDLFDYSGQTIETISDDTSAVCRWFYDQSSSTNSKARASLSFQDLYNYGEKYDYDSRGRVTSQTDYFGAVLDSSDVLPDPLYTKYEYGLSGSTQAFQILYEHNLADKVTKVTYPGGLAVTYGYDDRGRLTLVGSTSDPDHYASLDYTHRDEIATMVLGNNTQKVNYRYNERGWLNSINLLPQDSGAYKDRFVQLLYYYGVPGHSEWGGQYNGNILAQVTAHGSTISPFNHYEYDALDRLTSWGWETGWNRFYYDKNGNRDSLISGESGNPTTHKWASVYHNDNRLDTIKLDGTINLNTYNYDSSGNVVFVRAPGPQLQLSWDLYGQLLGVHDTLPDGGTVSYGYTNAGQRVWKKYDWQEDTCTTGGGEEENLMYNPLGSDNLGYDLVDTSLADSETAVASDGLGGMMMQISQPPAYDCHVYHSEKTYYVLGQGGQVLAEYADLAGAPKARYIYAGSQRIAMLDSSNIVYYYLNDHLGSAAVLVDASGNIKDTYKYKPFGESNGTQVNVGQSYRYTGKPMDEEMDMDWYYYGARYYDPEIGRFLSVDPAGGKYPSWSPYAYCLNNPMRLVDPDGRRSLLPPSGAFARLNWLGEMMFGPPRSLTFDTEKPKQYLTNGSTGLSIAGGISILIPGGQSVGVTLLWMGTGATFLNAGLDLVDYGKTGNTDYLIDAAVSSTLEGGKASIARQLRELPQFAYLTKAEIDALVEWIVSAGESVSEAGTSSEDTPPEEGGPKSEAETKDKKSNTNRVINDADWGSRYDVSNVPWE